MSSQTLLYLVIGVAVLGLLIYRQLVARPVRGNQRIVLILVIIGMIEAVQYMQKLHSGTTTAAIALVGSLILAGHRRALPGGEPCRSARDRHAPSAAA